MYLELRDIIHVPDASKPFQFQMDLSQMEFYGQRPITRPVEIQGRVTNHAGALVLEGSASSLLDLQCDRCGKAFFREQRVPLDCLLAARLEDEDQDGIVLLEGTQVNLDEVAGTAFILGMDTKNLCSEDCKGLCARCGANLNDGPCGCRPEVDPRWAALARPIE